jgi:hypothetical protein
MATFWRGIAMAPCLEPRASRNICVDVDGAWRGATATAEQLRPRRAKSVLPRGRFAMFCSSNAAGRLPVRKGGRSC